MRSKTVSETLMAVMPMSKFDNTRASDPVAINNRPSGRRSAASIHPVTITPSAYKRPVAAPVSRTNTRRNRKLR